MYLHALEWVGVLHQPQPAAVLVFTTDCRGGLYSSTWSTSPYSFTDLGGCRTVSLKYFHSSPQLHRLPTMPLLLTGSALASSESSLELAGIGSIRHGGSFYSFSQEPLLYIFATKILQGNPTHLP